MSFTTRPVTQVAEVTVNKASAKEAPCRSLVAIGSIRRSVPIRMTPRNPKKMICEEVSSGRRRNTRFVSLFIDRSVIVLSLPAWLGTPAKAIPILHHLQQKLCCIPLKFV